MKYKLITLTLAFISAISAYAGLCYYDGLVVCHASGPATRIIPAGYPCAGGNKTGTDDVALIVSAVLAAPNVPSGVTGYTSLAVSPVVTTCVWAFNYPCLGDTEVAFFQSSFNRYVAATNSSSCTMSN